MNPPRRRRVRAFALALLAGLAAGCVDAGKDSPAAVKEGPPGTPAASAGPPSPATGPPSRPAAEALPAAEVPRAGITAETRIRSIRSLAGRTRETEAISSAAVPVFASIESLKEWMSARDPRQHTSRALHSMEQEWRLDGQAIERWMVTTGRRLDALSAARAELHGLEETWTLTAQRLAADGAAREIQDRARGVLDSIREVAARLGSETDKALLLQSRISAAKLDVEDALDALASAFKEERKILFRIESPPIWESIGPGTGGQPILEELRAAFRENGRALRHYASRARWNFNVQVLLFVLCLAAFYRLRPVRRAWPSEDKGLRALARLVRHPILGACLVALLCGRWIHPRAPLALYELSSILLVVPVVIMMRTLVHPRTRGGLYALAAIFVVERLWEAMWAGSFLERLGLLGLAGISAIALGWTIRPQAFLPTVVSERWWRAITVVGRIALAALAVSLVSNVAGNVTLARLLTATVVRMAYAGVVLYAAALILRGAAALVVGWAGARSFHTIGRHRDLILRRASLAIDAAAWAMLLMLALSSAHLLPMVAETVRGLLLKRWGIGDFRFSFASALVFLAAVYSSVLASRVIRVVLEEDVLPRVSLPRGVAGTVTMLTRYGVISLGFLFALAIAGIPLDRVTIVLGAFSVGIGFGLQTVVNNFVSGLILMFERPIQIGDAVEVSGLTGRVRRIGVRASTIETFEGAEVVVPNGMLVSNQLINWTLSSRNRRIEIQVGVAYGTDPERVIALLRDAAKGRPGVLDDPEPWTLFRGFGASSLDFSLFFWTADFDNWTRIRSDVTVIVNRSLNEAGIQIPFPQTDVHLHQ